ncbi:hypothetical protein JTE90_016934 [Oedothorax gibbosus]|uniref:Uncharacterized protein n=1 Tax=Oedothorax gibbosus TaxID=931172 RepID=A0AAV6UUR4_9ARAC|nr:hypothetical protein JTE90_016934 [Oedothorax gibbosus]
MNQCAEIAIQLIHFPCFSSPRTSALNHYPAVAIVDVPLGERNTSIVDVQKGTTTMSDSPRAEDTYRWNSVRQSTLCFQLITGAFSGSKRNRKMAFSSGMASTLSFIVSQGIVALESGPDVK